MPLVPIAALAALVVKFTDFLKALTNKDWNAAVTQVTVWLGGVAALFLASATVWAKGKGFTLGDIPLTDLDAASKVFGGMSISSIGGVVYDYKKARDNSDSAVQPTLVPGAVKVTEEPIAA